MSLPAPAGLAYRSASPTQGDFAGGLWNVGSLAPGATAALTVSVTPSTPGTRVVAAEVGSSTVLDPTSTPGNGAAEDDRAAVTLVVPGVAGAPTVRRLPRKLGVKVARYPRRGPASRLVVSGALTLPGGTPKLRCGGRVRVRALIGTRPVASSTATLRVRRGTCLYAVTLRPKKTGANRFVKVSATFLGTTLMRPRSSKPLKIRIR